MATTTTMTTTTTTTTAEMQNLVKLRPLGKLEQVSAACHHLGFFNNVGVSAHYRVPGDAPKTVLQHRVFAAVGKVVRRHRILSAVPVNEESSDAYFAALPSFSPAKIVSFLERTTPAGADGADPELDAVLETQHNTNFKADYGTLPFWRLVILQDVDKTGFTASFVFHHAIGDGVSGLVFHNAFRDALETFSDDTAVETVAPDETVALLPPLEELHPLPANTTPPEAGGADLKTWTGTPIALPCVSRWKSLSLSADASQKFFRDCKAHKTSVTAALSAIIAQSLFRIVPSDTDVLTCIVPVNLRPWLELEEPSIGTYFDATKVQFQKTTCADIWADAGNASGSINSYLGNVSPSGEPYTAVAMLQDLPGLCPIFKSLVGTPRDAAFEVTNIGQARPAPTGSWRVDKVLLSRGSVATGAALTISVATGGDGSMAIGFSWQDGVVGDEAVEQVWADVVDYFGRE